MWKDFGNAMDTRPTGSWTGDDEYTANDTNPDPLNLTVTRTAKNGEKQELILGTQYKVIYTKVGDNWTFTIDGIGTGELAKYASDGQAWTYTVTEGLGDDLGYTSSGSWSTAGKNEVGGEIDLGKVTNSIYTEEKFEKKWVDEAGKNITSQYIDFDVTVTFKLQVKAGDGQWQDASDFFDDKFQDVRDEVKISSDWTRVDGNPFTVKKTARCMRAATGRALSKTSPLW